MKVRQKPWFLLAAAMLLALCSGIGYAWSVFQKPMMIAFAWPLEQVSITFTIQVMVSTIAPVFLSRLQKRIGVAGYLRLAIVVYACGLLATRFTTSLTFFYMSYGVITGLGLAMLYPTLIAYATRLFPARPGLAAGLLSCAYGSGAILWAPVATLLMKQFGVLNVFALLAGIFTVVMLPVSFLILNNPPVVDSQPAMSTSNNPYPSTADLDWQGMLKTITYYVLLIALTLGTASGLMIAGHASGMLQEILTFTPDRAAVLVGFFAVFNALGRILFGFVSDRLGRYNVMMILFGVVCAAMIVMSSTGGVGFLVALFIVSACYGGFTAMFSPVCADNFGLKNLSVNYAFLYIAYGLAGFIGPQLAAFIRTTSGGYALAFTVVAGMSAFGFVLVLALKAMRRRSAS